MPCRPVRMPSPPGMMPSWHRGRLTSSGRRPGLPASSPVSMAKSPPAGSLRSQSIITCRPGAGSSTAGRSVRGRTVGAAEHARHRRRIVLDGGLRPRRGRRGRHRGGRDVAGFPWNGRRTPLCALRATTSLSTSAMPDCRLSAAGSLGQASTGTRWRLRLRFVCPGPPRRPRRARPSEWQALGWSRSTGRLLHSRGPQNERSGILYSSPTGTRPGTRSSMRWGEPWIGRGTLGCAARCASSTLSRPCLFPRTTMVLAGRRLP